MFSGSNNLKRKKDGKLVSGNLVIDTNGEAYSYNQLISKRIGQNVFINNYRFSNTTSRHQSIVRARASSTLWTAVYIEVPDMGEFFRRLNSKIDLDLNPDLDLIANKISLEQNERPSESLTIFLSKYPGYLETLEKRIELKEVAEKLSHKKRLLWENLSLVKYKTPAIYERKLKELIGLEPTKEWIEIGYSGIEDGKIELFAEYFLALESDTGLLFGLSDGVRKKCQDILAVKALSQLGD